MIVNLIYGVLGYILGILSLALFVIAKEAEQVGRPPR